MVGLSRLRLLLALHERGTLHAAAAELHMSASAASQQLATLTREAGAPLTEVDGRRLRLTDAGKALVGHAYAIVATLERAHGDVAAAAKGELGRLTVGGFPSAVTGLLVPASAIVNDRHPRLRVDLREVQVPACLGELARGDLDLVVGAEHDAEPADEDPRFTRVSLGIDEFQVAVPAGHPFGLGRPDGLGLLADEEWVGTIEGDSCDQLLRRTCLSAGFRPRIRHRASDWVAILTLVEHGMGVALAPCADWLPVPAGVRLVTPVERIRRHLYGLVRCGSDARPSVALFMDALEEAARAAFRTESAAAEPRRG